MNDKVEEATADEGSARMPLGAILLAAREQHQWSIDDVSGQLRFSPRQVMALESDDFAALPEAMITRGFIRNYARLLEIDAEPLLQAYRSHTTPEPYAISIPSANILISTNIRRPWKMYFIVSLVIVLLLGLWVLYVDYLPKLKQQPFSSIFSPTTGAANAPAPLNQAQPTVVPLPERTNTTPMQQTVPPAVAATETPIAAQQGNTVAAASVVPTIKLAFSEESWVSVTDASNKELLNTIKQAGTEETVKGQPPFRIIIGNSAGVQLTYNDEPVDLGPHTKLNVARITLE